MTKMKNVFFIVGIVIILTYYCHKYVIIKVTFSSAVLPVPITTNRSKKKFHIKPTMMIIWWRLAKRLVHTKKIGIRNDSIPVSAMITIFISVRWWRKKRKKNVIKNTQLSLFDDQATIFFILYSTLSSRQNNKKKFFQSFPTLCSLFHSTLHNVRRVTITLVKIRSRKKGILSKIIGVNNFS